MKYIILVIASLILTHNNNITSTVSSNIVSELISINNNSYYDSQTGYGSINNQTIQGFEKKFLCQLNVNSNNPNGYKIFVKSNNASHLILSKNNLSEPLAGEKIKYKIHNSNSNTSSQEVSSANIHTLILTNEYEL